MVNVGSGKIEIKTKNIEIMKTEEKVTMELTPQGIIFLALGGYQNPEAKELAKEVAERLQKFMETHRQDIVVWNERGQKSIRFLGKNE